MTNQLTWIVRKNIDTLAWDACVTDSVQRLVYGYSWYLDAVLPAPDWKWVGLVLRDEHHQYQAVMPVPLRRKFGRWVVHQPLFCQFLTIFSAHEPIDEGSFLEAMHQRFRYGSMFCFRFAKATSATARFPGSFVAHPACTQVLDLAIPYKAIAQGYARDRKQNLRRAETGNWQVVDSTDLTPLLGLFQNHHANAIEGGVASWAYSIFTNLYNSLAPRGLATLRYAVRDGRIEAGALFVQEGNRIIYLFNAASETGRKGHARTLLIDQLIRERAGKELVFDFESPEKTSIADFYQSFGTREELFYKLRWNRLTRVERSLIALKKTVR